MNLHLTASHPAGGTDTTKPLDLPINPESLECGQEINSPGTMMVRLKGDVAAQFDNMTATNPSRTDTILKLYDVDISTTDPIWRGTVLSRTASMTEGRDYAITLNLQDDYGKLRTALCAKNSAITGELFKTNELALDGVNYFTLVSPHAELPYYYYPTPVSYTNAWYPYSGDYAACSAYLGAEGTNVATTLVSSSDFDRGIAPQGFMKVNNSNEFFYYDGYDLNAVGTGAVYVWKQCKRNCFGTTAGDPTPINTKVWQAQPKRIHPGTAVVVQGYAGGTTWETIDPGNYQVDSEQGRIVFYVDPLTDAMTPALTALPTAIRGFWKVYDETAADAWVLGGDNTYGTLELFLGTAKTYGGPELTSGDWDIVLDRMVVPRVYMDSPMLLGDAIESLLTDPGGRLLRVMPATDAAGATAVPCELVGIWQAYPTNKITVKQLPLTTSSSYIYHAKNITENADLREVYSAIVVSYQEIYDPDAVPQALIVYLTSSYSAVGPGGQYYRTVAMVQGDRPIPKFAPPVNLGTCSAGAAYSIGRGLLLQSLHLSRSRDYELCHSTMRVPTIGNNYVMPDGYEGTCTAWRLSSQNGAHYIRMTVVDMTEEYS